MDMLFRTRRLVLYFVPSDLLSTTKFLLNDVFENVAPFERVSCIMTLTLVWNLLLSSIFVFGFVLSYSNTDIVRTRANLGDESYYLA